MPYLNKLYRDYGSNKKDLILLTIGYNTSVADMERKYVDSLGVEEPCFSFSNNNMFDWYAVRHTLATSSTAPLYGLVGPNMEVLHGEASGSVSNLRKVIESIPAIHPVTTI